MSDSNGNEHGMRSERVGSADRIDALLSAERDRALDGVEQRELEVLLASDSAATERRAAFAAVDEALRALGHVPLDDASIEAGLDALRARTAADRGRVVRIEPRRAGWQRPLLAVAAAAALMIYLAIAPLTDRVGSDALRSESVVSTDLSSDREEMDEDSGFDPELAIALGYGEGADFVPGVDNEDLSVISELDLLDFMSKREEEERG